MDPLTIGLALASQFAPSIIKHFTNSDTAGQVAGQVIDIAKTVTGKGTPDEAMTALQADPALAIQFKTAVMQNETELEKAYLGDRQGARAMQTAALQQEDRFSKQFIYWFALAWSTFAMVYFVAVTFIDIPPGGQRVADTILGVLISCVLGSIVQFFYGSTRGSQKKDDTVNKLAYGSKS